MPVPTTYILKGQHAGGPEVAPSNYFIPADELAIRELVRNREHIKGLKPNENIKDCPNIRPQSGVILPSADKLKHVGDLSAATPWQISENEKIGIHGQLGIAVDCDDKTGLINVRLARDGHSVSLSYTSNDYFINDSGLKTFPPQVQEILGALMVLEPEQFKAVSENGLVTCTKEYYLSPNSMEALALPGKLLHEKGNPKPKYMRNDNTLYVIDKSQCGLLDDVLGHQPITPVAAVTWSGQMIELKSQVSETPNRIHHWNTLDHLRIKLGNHPQIKPEMRDVRVKKKDLISYGYSRALRDAKPDNLIREMIDLNDVDYPIENLPDALRTLLRSDGTDRKVIKRLNIVTSAGCEPEDADRIGGELHLDDGLVINFDLKRDETGEVWLAELSARGAAVLKNSQVVLDETLSEKRNQAINSKIASVQRDDAETENILNGIESIYQGIIDNWPSNIKLSAGIRMVLEK